MTEYQTYVCVIDTLAYFLDGFTPNRYGYFAGWNYQVKSVLDSTEAANYTGSYTTVRNGLVDNL
jgi:hypothetical protein